MTHSHHPPPPDNNPEIGDINTGQAYLETYRKLIENSKEQVLLPVIFYIDGASTGQFANYPITALKFTLGIFTQEARKKFHMWRTLGYVPVIPSSKSQARRKFHESLHSDAVIATHDLEDEEGKVEKDPVTNAQDLHTMLDLILASYREIEATGFYWDLMYKNKVHRNIHFVLFCPFVKCDTDEADRLTGAYTSRGKYVQQLCRYCCCPTMDSDNCRPNYPPKTQQMLETLVKNQDIEGLKRISQQFLSNAWYSVRFGSHSLAGIHGACPLDMLHAILLGIFKYVRDCFFDQIGRDSAAGKEIIAYAYLIGDLLSRQSDRDKPRTKFSNGIEGGKLQANEYAGVLLVLAALLHCSGSKAVLLGKKQTKIGKKGNKKGPKPPFTEDQLKDWVQLIETLLMWHAWLKSDRMETAHVKRSLKKHQFIMYLIRKVAKRGEGTMGWKIVKFHAISHMSQDIINFGVPITYNVEAEESHHKPSKGAAKQTQKRKDTFDEQVCKRLHERHALDMAMEEIAGVRPKWDYFQPRIQLQQRVKELPNPKIYGQKFYVNYTQDVPALWMEDPTSKEKREISIERTFLHFLSVLAERVAAYRVEVVIRSTYMDPTGAIYRATPSLHRQPWRDWVVVDWGPDGQLPCMIWGFVDLTGLPADNNIECGGLSPVKPEVYAIVESGKESRKRSDGDMSEIFSRVTKDVGRIRDGRVVEGQFYLADVEAFVEPIAVIPDVGGNINSYLQLRRRCYWREDFIKWLKRPYEEWKDFEEEAAAADDSDESDDLSD